jgi:hypothetical protein
MTKLLLGQVIVKDSDLHIVDNSITHNDARIGTGYPKLLLLIIKRGQEFKTDAVTLIC